MAATRCRPHELTLSNLSLGTFLHARRAVVKWMLLLRNRAEMIPTNGMGFQQQPIGVSFGPRLALHINLPCGPYRFSTERLVSPENSGHDQHLTLPPLQLSVITPDLDRPGGLIEPRRKGEEFT